MADWHASVPLARWRPVGTEVRPSKCSDSARAVFRSRRPDWCRPWLHQENAEHARRRSETGSKANEGHATMKKKNPHWGSSLDDFLEEEGIYDEVVAQVEKEVIAWQLQEAMKKKK